MEANKWRYLVERLVGYLADGTELYYVELGGPHEVDGVATTIPTTSSNGHGKLCSMSVAVEDDTGDVRFYNEENGWGDPVFSFKT